MANVLQIMADNVYTWMETNLATYNVGFEELPAQKDGLMLQSSTDDPVFKEYKSGRKVYRYRFSLLMRAGNDDTYSRVDAQRKIQEAADALCGATLTMADFNVWKIRQDSTARIIGTDEQYDVVMVQMHVDYERI